MIGHLILAAASVAATPVPALLPVEQTKFYAPLRTLICHQPGRSEHHIFLELQYTEEANIFRVRSVSDDSARKVLLDGSIEAVKTQGDANGATFWLKPRDHDSLVTIRLTPEGTATAELNLDGGQIQASCIAAPNSLEAQS